jgi:hypothetical protein
MHYGDGAAAHRSSRLHHTLSRSECTDPMLTPTSITSSRTVIRRSCMIKVRTWSITLSFRLVEGLTGHGSLSTDVQPSLKRLNHSFMHEKLMALSAKALWMVCSVYRQAFGRIWCSIAAQVILLFCNNRLSDEWSVHFLTHRPTDTFCGPEEIWACTWMFPTQLHLRTHRNLHLFTREKLRFDTFWIEGYIEY